MSRSLGIGAVTTAVVTVTALAAVPPLVDPETGAAARGVALLTPWRYDAGAPLYAVLDQLSLLTTRQHAALVLTAVLGFATWRRWRAAQRARHSTTWPRRVGAELRAASCFVAVLLFTYMACALPNRPMARLRAVAPDDVIVDFHSHTNASHDGRRSFTLEANRAWHKAAGFDAAYVTDHASRVSPAPGPFANPVRAGEGEVLLPGIELVDETHVVGLGSAVAAVAPRRGAPPAWAVRHAAVSVLIQTLPETLALTPRAGWRLFGTGVTAIELVDAAPRGLAQSARDRRRVLALAERLDLAVVASSNNHGWGRTAAAWNVLSLPGWRDDTPPELGARIERLLRERRRRAVRVVARRATPVPSSVAGLALTAPALAWTVLTTLSPGERLAWLAWTWGAVGSELAWAAWRARRRAAAPTTLQLTEASRTATHPASDDPTSRAA